MLHCSWRISYWAVVMLPGVGQQMENNCTVETYRYIQIHIVIIAFLFQFPFSVLLNSFYLNS